uniref:Protein maternal effect lethal 26 n=2 Tax=Cajanus cajan TaxID=3821 RepID=A0A151U2K6_CAJCA|nr:Protein maternal effect lethal 26 [Cajanus cajan]
MNDSTYKVETTCRLAQWTIHNLPSSTYRKSDPFKIATWNWHLSVEKNRVSLYPELYRHNPPIASFILRLLTSLPDRKPFARSEIKDKLLANTEGFVWILEAPLPAKFIIHVEFLDLKTATPNGGEPCSIWPSRFLQQNSNAEALNSLGLMLTQDILTDITINTNESDESIRAHRAVLASRSPVFRSMFSHKLKENHLSTINISDMSMEACQALLSYLYGTIKDEEFLMHRLALLHAADKYDIYDLREACHESLLEDIDSNNVLERLQSAYLYQLPKLKSSCMEYLVKFGKLFDIRDDFFCFLQSADRDLISEVFHEVLNVWTGF